MAHGPGIATGESGESYLVSDQELLDALLHAVVGHEVHCGVRHLLAAAGLCFESSACRGSLTPLEAMLIASLFRAVADSAERIARAYPDPSGGGTPRAAA